MIDEKWKYFCPSGELYPGGPSTWHVVNWDQRRVVSVTMDGEQEDDNIFIEHFRRHGDQLPSGIFRIHVSPTGEIVSMYTDPEDDPTYCIYYPSLHDASLPGGTQIVRRDALEELERFGPHVDLVAYPSCAGTSAKKVVFKYHILWQDGPMSWKEMNLWMRLPGHPHIVPFDRVVVDELESRVMGFTSHYVPGGNLKENKSRVFKLKWLQQLIEVVDILNLEYGIAHQDIAPRNLLVDESTDSIMLFDLNRAARIIFPSPGEGEFARVKLNDIKFVMFTMHEIITQVYSPGTEYLREPHADSLGIEWVKHPETKLDHPVESYQLMLQEWQKRRAEDLHPGDGSRAIDWPSMPGTINPRNKDGEPTDRTVSQIIGRRQSLLARGDRVLNWERPPQRVLNNGVRLLSTGEIIN